MVRSGISALLGDHIWANSYHSGKYFQRLARKMDIIQKCPKESEPKFLNPGVIILHRS